MTWTERSIASALARQTFASRCILLVDNCQWTGHECDILGVSKCLRIIDIEVKISRADLKADRDKNKWWQQRWRNQGPTLEWPERVWKHYYAMPADIWKPDLVAELPSKASGVLLLSDYDEGGVVVKCERRAKPRRDAYRLTAADVVDIARLANLRMWDAYKLIEKR